MMRLQKEMFSRIQETMKMQSEVFYKTVQQLNAGTSNSQGNQPENKLPAQVEKLILLPTLGISGRDSCKGGRFLTAQNWYPKIWVKFSLLLKQLFIMAYILNC